MDDSSPLDRLDDLFGASTLAAAVPDALNEQYIADAVRAGTLSPAILDHVGHMKHNIYNPSCEFCTRAQPTEQESR